MRLTDPVIERHLARGGKIKLSRLAYGYVALKGGELYWFQDSNDKILCAVEAFVDIISKDWEMVVDLSLLPSRPVSDENVKKH